MAHEVTPEEMEDGMARAKLHRLVAELAKARGDSFAHVYAGLMSTHAWAKAGRPDPKFITARQVAELVPLLERQIAKARDGQLRPRHIVSKAPPAPWAREAGQDRQGGKIG